MEMVEDFMSIPKADREAERLGLQFNKLPEGLATNTLGMGTWRLRGACCGAGLASPRLLGAGEGGWGLGAGAQGGAGLGVVT
jgi:hypothetical protein